MHRIYSALIDIVAAAIFIVPLLALYGKISLRSLKQTLIYIVFAFYLVAVLSLVGFPSVLSLNLDFTINIIPLVDMISDFVNACLNVLLFVPLGFLSAQPLRYQFRIVCGRQEIRATPQSVCRVPGSIRQAVPGVRSVGGGAAQVKGTCTICPDAGGHRPSL